MKQTVDVPSHVQLLTSEQAVANVTRNPCKLYPLLPQPSSLSTISRGPGECLCSPGSCLCTHTSRFALCILPSCVHGRIASIARFGRRRPARLPASQKLVRVAADGAPSLAPFRPSLATRTLPAAAVKPSLPAQWWPSTSFYSTSTGTSLAVRPSVEFSIARRHHGRRDEGIVDTRELARKLILKLVLAESKRAIAPHKQRPSLARLGWVNRRA